MKIKSETEVMQKNQFFLPNNLQEIKEVDIKPNGHWVKGYLFPVTIKNQENKNLESKSGVFISDNLFRCLDIVFEDKEIDSLQIEVDQFNLKDARLTKNRREKCEINFIAKKVVKVINKKKEPIEQNEGYY